MTILDPLIAESMGWEPSAMAVSPSIENISTVFDGLQDICHGEGDCRQIVAFHGCLGHGREQREVEAIIGMHAVHLGDGCAQSQRWGGRIGNQMQGVVEGGAIADQQSNRSGRESEREGDRHANNALRFSIRAKGRLHRDAVSGMYAVREHPGVVELR